MTKDWARFRMAEHNSFVRRVLDITKARDEAMEELEQLDPHLYAKACEKETSRFPLHVKEPMETPSPAVVGMATSTEEKVVETKTGKLMTLAELRDRAMADAAKSNSNNSESGDASR